MHYPYPLIEELLEKFRLSIGVDFDRYRNHVYRVFLSCLLLDDNKLNEEKYALAAVFHDIGIWTDHTFDYLNPSIEQAKIYLHSIGRQDWTDEISQMIYWHHKLSTYQGKFGKLVETFRKADWIDVSLGVFTFGIDTQKIRQNRRMLPNRGFHFFLVRETAKNLLKHPFNPLPIFKR
ncbi:HD domain-containing protein [Spirosoma sp. KNUC1025]|uniref:HD domain-containing protein n=1 Tax=Spirosoma sp. KNUC1025 TaxID=2894082 RepID=UPI00386A76D9|nr:HD domain-containing protein [Spirosoma sp. KNUC1025]